ncbi:nitroreductase family protein [Clostridium sporogenes]|uniref:Nitroreductase family protein n=1 Tax=Clostridium sporogenes TaxID=1509 RepID=A0A1L3NGG9_CLOSG|nr:nitroreductase family protein [Clostridium sporogenes]APH15225.1 nitroreductase family protein [Clostridium sporogenes]
MKEIFNRRSIRKYKDKPVEKEKVDKLLRAAMQAPSSLNKQPWEFIVVEDKSALNKLSLAMPYSKPVAGSAVTLVLLANSNDFKFPDDWQQDMSAAAQNILLETTHLELGAVWLGIAALDSAVDYVKKMYSLPDNIKPFALIAIGYPDEHKNKFIDRYKAEKVHYEKWT